MNKAGIGILDRRRVALESDRTGVETVWQLIEMYMFPFRGEFFGNPVSEMMVDWRKRKVYDGTAAIASQNLAANMNSGLTNPLFQWFLLKVRQEELNDDHGVKKWLQFTAKRIFEALQDSNFELSANECYLDLPTYGTSCMIEEVEENKVGDLKELVFSAAPPGEYVFETDAKGNNINFWRVLKWTSKQLEEKFGYDKLPEVIQLQLKNQPDNTDKHNVVLCIYKRHDIDEMNRFQVLSAEKRPYGRIYYLEAGLHQLGEEGGYYEMPVYTPRWRTTSGSIWGNSPAMLCLSNVLSLNELEEYILKNLEKAVDPPTIGTKRGVVGDVDLSAGGHTVVRSVNDLIPFLSKGDFNAGELKSNDLRDMINRTFFMDQLQLKQSPAMTATEVNARFQLMQRLLGPTLNRLQVDWLDPLIQRTFGILYRYKKLPDLPAALQNAEAELDIEYAGPMAKAQQENQAAAIEQYLETIAQMAAVFPAVLDVPKVSELAVQLAELRGLQLDKVFSKAEQQAKQYEQQKAALRAQELEQADQQAGILKQQAEAGLKNKMAASEEG